jgi:hypothetical protein
MNKVSSIQDLNKFLPKEHPKKEKWIFRGQQKFNWKLESSLERACEKSFGCKIKKSNEIEEILLREFQRRFHHYEIHVPAPSDKIEWLAIMQHYGAPTRLLDWTYSKYIGLYFSIKSYNDENMNHALWAIDLRWLQNKSFEIIKKLKEFKNLKKGKVSKINVENFFTGTPTYDEKNNVGQWLFKNKFENVIFSSTPFKLNERLAIQKGLSLSTADAGQRFHNVLETIPGFKFGDYVHKLEIDKNKRIELIKELQLMNISADTLYPGLEGFASSLSVYHHRIDEL